MRLDFKNTPPKDIYPLLTGLVAPRPIALITSLGSDGRLNAAPFSAYNYLCTNPPIVGIGVAARNAGGDELKDTARNIQQTGEFVVNVVTEDIAQKMNICGIEFPPEVSELEMAGFTTEPSLTVKVPRLKEAHAALECRLYQAIKPGSGPALIILGEVVGAYVEDRYMEGRYVLAKELHSIGRMNALDNYVRTQDAFISIPRLNYDQWQKGDRGKA